MLENFYVKAHGLGNEYVVFDSKSLTHPLTTAFITRVCDIHYGLGTDGVLLKVPSKNSDFGLKIYNPDGSDAEKSGNGLRIFCKYLHDYGFLDSDTFTVETLGGIVDAQILETRHGKAQKVKIDMGKASFDAQNIPVVSEHREVMGENITILDRDFSIHCVSIGNPHCVIFTDNPSESLARKYGPHIENNTRFPKRINVQFVKVIDRSTVYVQIWERGAGYTLASGSSSCAVVSVCRKLGLVDTDVTVVMPGGKLDISVDESFNIRMAGPVREIATGVISNEFLEDCH